VARVRKDALTPDLARRVLDAVADDRYEAAYALGMLGLRASEVLGLARSDLHLDGSPPFVDIRWQIVGSGVRAKRAPLKTAASEEPVALPPFVESRLRAHLAQQPTPIDDALVFVTEAGFAVNASWLTKHFAALVTAAGLPRMTLHDLRHGAVSLLIEAGVHPRVAQELLRHASSRTTMEVYGHVSASQRRDAIDILERAVAG
jgi:integrase